MFFFQSFISIFGDIVSIFGDIVSIFGDIVYLFGYFSVVCTLCPSQITAQSNALDVWKSCLHDGFCITLFRDEVLYMHKEIQSLFDSMKG